MDKNALYYQDHYVKEFDAEVTDCTAADGHWLVELSVHGFYPEGGGQDADHGSIGEAAVLDVQEVPVTDPASGENEKESGVLHTFCGG